MALYFIVCTPAHLEPARWWWSPSIVAALAVTPAQSRAIERLYEDKLPARQLTSETVISLTEQVAKRLRDGHYDAELLTLTGQLVSARRHDCEQRRQSLLLSAGPLSKRQRDALMRLIEDRQVAE